MGKQLVLWEEGPFKLTPRQLSIAGAQALTRGQVTTAITRMAASHDAGSWGMGDLAFRCEQDGHDSMVSDIADVTTAGPEWIRRCYYVAKAIEPSQRKYELSFTHYAMVYTFPEDVRNKLLALAERKGWGRTEFREHLKGLRRNVKEQLLTFPEGRYGLIYADPPWQYNDGTTDPSREIENQYPTMSLDEICALKDGRGRQVQEVASQHAVLYLWATNALLPEAMRVIDSWGFTYKSNHVWVKPNAGMGYWTRGRHEMLLIATKGSPLTIAEDKRPDSVIMADTSIHSRKPAVVREMLDEIYPAKIPRIELFAREAALGWHIWGLEAPDGTKQETLQPVDDAEPATAEDQAKVVNIVERTSARRRKAAGKDQAAEEAAATTTEAAASGDVVH